MEKLLKLIKVLLSILSLSRKRERIITPRRLTEVGREVEIPPPAEERKIVLKDPPVYKNDGPKNYIWCDGERHRIKWEKVVTYKEESKWSLPAKNMKLEFGDRKVEQFVVHWDGCLDSKMCHRVLANRGLSVHFCIDNDGTIIQLMDTNNIAWHARGVNTTSIGVEVSNAVYTKYAKKYNPRRPVLDNVECHGKQIGPILGFSDEQVKALKVLTKTICNRYKIPLEVPLNDNGELIKGVAKSWKTFKGVMAHYHLNKGKTDPAGLDLKEVVKDETK